MKEAEDVIIPEEFNDYLEVMAMGAKKHGANNWLDDDGSKSSRTQMFDSLFHHIADAYAGIDEDEESGLHPLLHAISRAKMIYTREKRGIVHKED